MYSPDHDRFKLEINNKVIWKTPTYLGTNHFQNLMKNSTSFEVMVHLFFLDYDYYISNMFLPSLPKAQR